MDDYITDLRIPKWLKYSAVASILFTAGIGKSITQVPTDSVEVKLETDTTKQISPVCDEIEGAKESNAKDKSERKRRGEVKNRKKQILFVEKISVCEEEKTQLRTSCF